MPSAASMPASSIGALDPNTSGGSRHGDGERPASAASMADQTRSGVHGRSRWRMPRCDSASITAFCTAGVAPMVAASPMPLAPSGFSGDGVSVEWVSKPGNSAADAMPVVGEVGREQVAVVVVAHLFEERLSDAGRDAAVLLSFDEQRIEHRAAVVDGDVAHEPHRAGVGIDLDHRDVSAEGKRARRPDRK